MIRFLILVILLISCTTLSKNQVQYGSLSLRGGTSGTKIWRDSLHFKKVSWYQELVLLYDSYIASIDEENPFINWLSPASKDLVKSCKEFYITLNYAQNSSKISRWMFYKEMRRNGFRKIELPLFEKNALLHPEWENLSLTHYEVTGLCRMHSENESVMVSFPGYMEAELLEAKVK